MAEQLANFGETTLNEALDDTETTVTVTDGAVFPSSGNFRVVVDDELMVVTARSTNDLTVTRGAESTSAAAHANGADIRMVLTAASLPAHVQQTLGSLAVDLSVAGAATADFSTAATHDWTLTGAATATLTGAMTDYATDYRLIVRQDATGGRDFDLDTNNSITWVGMGTASPTFGTAASSVDVIGLVSTDDGTSYLGFHTNPDLTNPMTTSGDVIYGGASGVPTRLAAGTNGHVLTLASGVPSWAASVGATFVGAKVYNSAVQAISDSTATDLTFNSEDFDTDSIHSTVTNTARLTVPTGQGGKWFVWARTTIAAAASGAARLALYVNGSAASAAAGRVPIDPTDTASVHCEDVLDLSAGQYVTANIYQNSAASMDVGNGSTRIYQSEFGMYRVG